MTRMGSRALVVSACLAVGPVAAGLTVATGREARRAAPAAALLARNQDYAGITLRAGGARTTRR